MDKDPVRFKDVLRSEGRRLGIEAAVETGAIFSRWQRIVGDAVAEHARPTSLREGVLRVKADSPVWATEISYLASEIQRRANEEVGAAAVREVRVWWGPGETEARTPVAPEGDGGRVDGPRSGSRARSDDPVGALERARRAWRLRARRALGPP